MIISSFISFSQLYPVLRKFLTMIFERPSQPHLFKPSIEMTLYIAVAWPYKLYISVLNTNWDDTRILKMSKKLTSENRF